MLKAHNGQVSMVVSHNTYNQNKPKERSVTPLSPVWDLVAMAVGLFWFVHIDIGGQLYFSELLLAAVFLPLWSKWGWVILKDSVARRIFILGLIWLFGQMFTDIYRHIPTLDIIRGWSAIGFFLIDFTVLYILLAHHPKRLLKFTLAFTIGGILQVIVDPNPYAAIEWWKFGYGIPVSLLFFYIGSRYFSHDKSKLLMVGFVLALLSVFWNARSLGGMILVTVILFYMVHSPFFKNILFSGKKAVVGMRLFLILFGGLIALLSIYSAAGHMGIFSERAQAKFDMDASGKLGIIGIVLGGRSEILASMKAVSDSPIIGHGSWAKDEKYKWYLLKLAAMGYGGRDNLDAVLDARSDLIPSHSTFMQAWVWAGILGALFWGYILLVMLRVFVTCARFPPPYFLVLIFVLLRSLWDWAFSPFGSGLMRITWAWELIFMLALYAYSTDLSKKSVQSNIKEG